MVERMLKSHHSLHYEGSAKSSTEFEIYSKSDFDISLSTSHCNDQLSTSHSDVQPKNEVLCYPGEYYKRYEHDEVPVKDSNNTMPSKGSMTNSDLKKLETRIFSNISQELQTDESSLGSLESNIKFFKTTVEKVFDNFYASMRDFDLYKKRFNDILEKNTQGTTIEDMEEFIKDMFEHIMSSENSASNINSSIVSDAVSTHIVETPVPKNKTSNLILDSYINENYLTDSTLDDDTSKGKTAKIEELFNLLILNDPQVQITMNNRHLLSEINIRKPFKNKKAGSAASADNIKKLAEKRMEVEGYNRQQNNIPDREIPVKVSFAKKNIYLDEDFASKETNEKSRSLLSKICSTICRKFRRQY